MASVSTKHEFVSPKPASTDPTLWDSDAINADHVYAGGADGEVIGWDPASATKTSWVARIPDTPVTSYGDIPVGKVRCFFGGSPTKFAIVYNDNGIFREISITL